MTHKLDKAQEEKARQLVDDVWHARISYPVFIERITANELALQREESELKGVGKMLDMLWENSHYALGKAAADRIKEEMVYYFGKDWSADMYKFIGRDREIKTLEQLKDGKTNSK